MGALDDAPHVEADDRATWRAWLEANHTTSGGAWLVTWRPRSGRVGLDYEAAIEEALCFGWVDSTGGRVDDDRGKLYFAPRKSRSPWAATNKARVERLTNRGTHGTGRSRRDRTRQGERVVGGAGHRRAAGGPGRPRRGARGPSRSAAANFGAFPPSTRKMHLGWVALARRPETRAARVAQIAEAAARNERART